MTTEDAFDPRLLDEAVKYLCEISLHDYVKEAWNHIESSPFADNWHIHAICEHLEAVSRGEIKKLLINIPPGCSKSLLTSVFWPTWEWITNPTARFFYASYDSQLSTRDSVKCRSLIHGPWYHGLWHDRYVFVNDQNQKTYYENDKGGYRLATSVGGHGTGQHPDRIVCFPGDTTVTTPNGSKRIDQIAAGDDVLSGDPHTETISTQTVRRIMRRAYNGTIMRVTLSDGRIIRATPEHPIWTTYGWQPATELRRGHEVLVHGSDRQLGESVLLDKSVIVDVEREQFSGHVYNLDVSGPSTYFAGHILVHNCDDPHNVRGAESEKNREAVIEWWNLTMSTRGVSRGVARVIIMQRLHQKDLSGYLLDTDDYVHICLPMRYERDRMTTTVIGFNDPRTEEGELLTPRQFNELAVTEIERGLGMYGSAGQLQQRPAPKEGGIFNTAWFNVVEAAPESMPQVVRWWDFAATENDGDFTCGGKVGRSIDGRYFISHVKRGQWSSAVRDREIKHTVQRDGHGPHQWCEQEPGSGGKTVAENFVKMLDGYTARSEPTRGDKVRNAEPLAAQAEVGNVFVVADQEGDRWNEAFFQEFELFPFAEHDDIVDAISKAFNKVAAMSHAILSPEYLRYFEQRTIILTRLHVDKQTRDRAIDEGTCQRVAVIKCGATNVLKSSKVPWTVLQVWDYHAATKTMFLRYAWRRRFQWNEIVAETQETFSHWRFKKLLIVHDDVGTKLHGAITCTTTELVSSQDKSTVELSVPLQDAMQQERVLLPAERSDWRETLESELTSWTGADDEDTQQIVCASFAARYLAKKSQKWGGTVNVEAGQTIPYRSSKF